MAGCFLFASCGDDDNGDGGISQVNSLLYALGKKWIKNPIWTVRSCLTLGVNGPNGLSSKTTVSFIFRPLMWIEERMSTIMEISRPCG